MPRFGFAATVLAVGWIAGGAGPTLSLAADSVLFRHADPSATDQVIVKWRDSGVAAVQLPSIEQRAARLRAVSGADVQPVHTLYGRVDVLRVERPMTPYAMGPLLAQLRVDPGVEYAEPDGWRFIEQNTLDTLPNDPHFSAGSDANGSWLGQWYLLPSSSTTPSAISATTAWHTTTGASSVIVAVIDTGIITAHPDLASKLLPGYDFVSCDQGNTAGSAQCSAAGSAATYYFANDGQDWHADASDPGDWISAADVALSLFQNAGCTTTAPSSWHGTKVAGVIGAITNNGIGIAGIAPATMLLPIRAIGVCTGRVSDIAAAITWAYGGAVTGVPTNPSPANIINLSLGAATACSATEQDAVAGALAANVLVVAAAGNAGGPVNAPANCSGVLSVAGLRAAGTKVGYSSLSSTAAAVSIAAPAGNCVNTTSTEPCAYSIETTSDAGSTTPSSTPGFYTYALLNPSYLDGGGNADNAANVGTSFAAPMASGVAALMLADTPSMTPSQLIARMQSSALSFPPSSSTTSTQCQLAATTTDANGNYTDTSQNAECVCTTATCGAGMLNAASAVQAASGIFVQITTSHSSASPGQHVTLNGSGSTAATGDTIVSYQWTTIPPTSNQLLNANQAIATFVMPGFRSFQVQLTITDSGGHTASGTATIESAFGAAGGGSFGPELLILALLSAVALMRRRYAPRQSLP
ncbi:MAG TPA: S8 family serine peptidase [Steroidobacteraceae bacterium]|nr:S8 family serine peptidase [Steroidobacteraceae bacterium]